MKKIYFAGKFNLTLDNKKLSKRLKNDYRSILLGNSLKLTFPDNNTKLKNYPIKYGGPFYFEQASNGDFTSTDCNTVIKEEMKSIKKCDIFCCVFDMNFSVGSVVELIQAANMKKRIVIFYKNENNNYTIKSEYWFAIAKSIEICKKNNTIIETFSYEDNLIAIMFNWLTNIIYTKRCVNTRQSSLNKYLIDYKIINKYKYKNKNCIQYKNIKNNNSLVVEKYDNGLTIVKSNRDLKIKGLVDVSNNSLYLDENINNIIFTITYIEGSDGVGKSSTINKLIKEGIVCLDRSENISKYMIFNISMNQRIEEYRKYLQKISPYRVIFLINNSEQELKKRINKRKTLSKFDKLAYEYNQLYLNTYVELCKLNLNNPIKIIDCTNFDLSRQVLEVKNHVLKEYNNE